MFFFFFVFFIGKNLVVLIRSVPLAPCHSSPTVLRIECVAVVASEFIRVVIIGTFLEGFACFIQEGMLHSRSGPAKAVSCKPGFCTLQKAFNL